MPVPVWMFLEPGYSGDDKGSLYSIKANILFQIVVDYSRHCIRRGWGSRLNDPTKRAEIIRRSIKINRCLFNFI